MTAAQAVVVIDTLEANEEVIQHGMRSFVEVGEALARIKEGDLYLTAGFDTFPDYCRERWGLSERYANDQIGAARVSAIALTQGFPTSETEHIARPLVRLMNEAGKYDRSTKELRDPDAAERAVIDAWARVVKGRDDESKPITASDVRRVISPPISLSGQVGWLELVGSVGDSLLAAVKHTDKLEAAVTRTPNQKVSTKLAEYAKRAEDLAARLRALGEGRP